MRFCHFIGQIRDIDYTKSALKATFCPVAPQHPTPTYFYSFPCKLLILRQLSSFQCLKGDVSIGNTYLGIGPLKHSCPPFAMMRSLVMQFRGILQAGKVETLEKWIGKAINSGIYSMKRFAKTLRRDWDAVQNALKEPYSNGPVEGQINRLKTLKRQMYGRAGFHLLRARLLSQPLRTCQALHQT